MKYDDNNDQELKSQKASLIGESSEENSLSRIEVNIEDLTESKRKVLNKYAEAEDSDSSSTSSKDSSNEKSDENKESTQQSSELTDSSDERSFFRRTFGPMSEGSLRGSIFILTNVALGISVFSLSLSFKTIGIFPAVAICLFLSFVSHNILKQLGRICKLKNVFDFSELVGLCFGAKIQTLFDICTILFLFGIMISAQVVSVNILGIVVYELGYSSDSKYIDQDDFIKNTDFWYSTKMRAIINLIIAFGTFLPFSLPKDIGKIAVVSVIGIGSLIYALIVS